MSPLKPLLCLLAAILPGPALAAPGWQSYLNDRYGYEVLVPPGFDGLGEPDAHDGQVFRSGDGRSRLTVWGGYLVDGTFEDELATRLDDLKSAGWTITYDATTPSWGSFSGTKGQRVIYMREISGCKGAQYAVFQLEYPATQIRAMNPVVDRLVTGLKQRVC
jgi:hypothetical protein